MKVGVVDIGTNSMRLLITDGLEDERRWVEVTGLGAGVDKTGELSDAAIERTIEVLGRFGAEMSRRGVSRTLAIATSASRDAANRNEFFDRAEQALGVRPTLIDGDSEARFAYSGAVGNDDGDFGVVVSDIGGGSTEIVTGESSVSIDIGSVRLTERFLPDRPASVSQLADAIGHVAGLFEGVDFAKVSRHIGVAGTWTSIAAIAQDLSRYEPQKVHGYVLADDALDDVTERLRGLTIEETAAIPSLDPARAPVILAGAVIATLVSETLGTTETHISERDTLDGAAMELLALA
ncbi:MAG: Ppx/GppA phosphatase family protein [Acidimicrobiia bacterium]